MTTQQQSNSLTQVADIITTLQHRADRGEAVRLGCVYVHAVSIIFIAPLFAWHLAVSTASPWLKYITFGNSAAPYFMAVALIIAGLLTLFGAATYRLRLTMVAISVIGAWYAAVGISFSITIYEWWQAGAVGSTQPPVYAVVIYFAMAALVTVQFHALWRMHNRSNNAGSSRLLPTLR